MEYQYIIRCPNVYKNEINKKKEGKEKDYNGDRKINTGN